MSPLALEARNKDAYLPSGFSSTVMSKKTLGLTMLVNMRWWFEGKVEIMRQQSKRAATTTARFGRRWASGVHCQSLFISSHSEFVFFFSSFWLTATSRSKLAVPYANLVDLSTTGDRLSFLSFILPPSFCSSTADAAVRLESRRCVNTKSLCSEVIPPPPYYLCLCLIALFISSRRCRQVCADRTIRRG